MVSSVGSFPSQVAYAKAQQTTFPARQPFGDGTSSAKVGAAKSTERSESRFVKDNDNDGDETSLGRTASAETQNAEAQRGSLLDISV